ncbi:MAG: cytochrome c-type biogenesis protein CcmH, partial [Dehalococcoidia bacterium]
MDSHQGRRGEEVARLIGSAIGPRRAIVILPLLLLIIGISCASNPASLEERAQSIDRRLMCPVCPAETIDQTQAELGVQMRELVRQKLRAGESEEQIFDFFVDKYGKSVLAEPPAEGFNLVVWIVPPVALAAGLALFWLAARQLGPRRRARPAGAVRAEELAPYLEEVEAEFLAFERLHANRGRVLEGGGSP